MHLLMIDLGKLSRRFYHVKVNYLIVPQQVEHSFPFCYVLVVYSQSTEQSAWLGSRQHIIGKIHFLKSKMKPMHQDVHTKGSIGLCLKPCMCGEYPHSMGQKAELSSPQIIPLSCHRCTGGIRCAFISDIMHWLLWSSAYVDSIKKLPYIIVRSNGHVCLQGDRQGETRRKEKTRLLF